MRRAVVAVLFLLMALAACGGSAPASDGADYDCRENTPGTGVLADDVAGRWMFMQNASPQYFTFDAGRNAVRTWTSDESDDVSYTTHEYSVQGNLVAIRDYGTYEFTFRDGLWSVDDPAADTDWIRCRPIED